MERNHNSAHVEHLDGVVCSLLQQHGAGHHRLYDSGAAGNSAPDAEADSPDAADERTAAPDAGNPGTLQRRPRPGIPGNHEVVPGVGSQPHRLPWSPGCTASHPDWPLSSPHPDSLYQAGRPGGTVSEALLLDNLCTHPLGGPAERQIPLAKPGRAGPLSRSAANPGGGFHLGAAKNDDDPLTGPAPAIQPKHDALDDSHFPGILFSPVAQRPAPLLDCVQYNRRGYPVFHYRLGAVVPVDPPVGFGVQPAGPVRRKRFGVRGDGKRWSQSNEPPEP